MFRISYQLPVIFGEDIYPTNMHAPTTVRMYVDPSDVLSGNGDPDALAQQVVEFHAGHISQWVQATRQVAYAGGNTVYGRRLNLDRCACTFEINNGQETLTLYVRPIAGITPAQKTHVVDIRSVFYRWPIPGSQTHGDPPPNWEFNGFRAEGNRQGSFYSFYDPPFAPGDRTTGLPVMAVGGTQPTFIFEDFHWEPSGPLDPVTAGGYVEALWLTQSESLGNGIGGTGYYDKLLSGKQYWEAEIRQLPTAVPGFVTHALSGTDDGSSYEDPTIRTTPVEYKMKYPAGLNTFLSPAVGLIPKHFEEVFTPPAKSKDYTQDQLDALPQVPPRDNIRFTHKLIGLDPTTDKPRSIGAVRSSVIMGDEVTTTVSSTPAEYWVDIPSAYWPLFYESSTQTEVLAPTSYGGTPVHYAYNYILAGWNAPLFTGFGSDTQLSFFLCGANPWWDVDPSLRPAIRDTQTIFEWDFIAAGGYIYQCVRFGDPSEGGLTTTTTTPSPVHGPWTIPLGGPGPGFVAPGAPAIQYNGTGGPYFRCCGVVPSGTAPWTGPAYIYVISGPRYDDPGSSFPTSGAVTEIRNGSEIPSTTLRAAGGGTPTTVTTTFPDQLFGDFLRQPAGGGDGGTRQPREVVVPLGKPAGRYTPLIKGRGDFMEDHYRDVVTTDANYDKDSSDNFGFDTGVDLGDLKVGDRIMWATDANTGKLWIGLNGVWKGPDGGPSSPKDDIGHVCLMDRETDPATGQLKPAAYYAAASYRYGPVWVRLWLGQGLKYKAPAGFDLLGRTTS